MQKTKKIALKSLKNQGRNWQLSSIIVVWRITYSFRYQQGILYERYVSFACNYSPKVARSVKKESLFLHHNNALFQPVLVIRKFSLQKKKGNKQRFTTTVFAWFSCVWLLVIYWTQRTASGTSFWVDWGDKKQIEEGIEYYFLRTRIRLTVQHLHRYENKYQWPWTIRTQEKGHQRRGIWRIIINHDYTVDLAGSNVSVINVFNSISYISRYCNFCQ